MQQEKRERVLTALSSYATLKGLFVQFKDEFSLFLEKENDFQVGINDSTESSFTLNVFDSSILTTFYMVFKDKDSPYGKICFERFVEEWDNEEIWVLYFDRLGNLREKLDQNNSFSNMTNSKDIEYIIFSLLEKFLQSSYFKDKE
jgi:hypothetical protein